MKLTPDLSLFVILAIFFLTYLVVRRFFLIPINRILVERATEHRSAEQVFEHALSRYNEATAAMEAQLHTAKREATAIRERFRAEAAAHRATVVDKTRAEAEQLVAAAAAKLTAEVGTAREQIVRDSDALAHTAASQILGRAI